MRFRVLGPLEIANNEGPIHIGGATSQRLLAALLLNANRIVTMDQLLAAAWNEELPRTARRQVQNRIAALRALLTREGAFIDTHEAGYSLIVAADDLDLERFEALAARARRQTDLARTAEIMREALGLWRGQALAGLRQGPLDAEAQRLDEMRLDLLGDYMDTELALGGHDHILTELRQLTAAHPLRERFATQLILALAHSGQVDAALNTYRTFRDRFVGDLGIEPSPRLAQVHQAVLRGDLATPTRHTPVAAEAAARPRPRQHPADMTAFSGRKRELAEIERVLTADDAQTPTVAAIHGQGGVGKSSLAIHAAHTFATRFGDGQLYVDLHGATTGLRPLTPLEVLGRFLRALGVHPSLVPGDIGEAASMFRSEAANRRMLIVLDNARDASQITPLLPGSPTCRTIVTSRRILTSLPGALHVPLGLLTESEAVAQLAALVGHQRVAHDIAAAQQVVRWCGRLPLALRVAGSRLAVRPAWTLATFAQRLANAQQRLDELELTDVGVRASLAVSHDELRDGRDPVDQQAARAFTLIGVWDGPDVSPPLVARLLEADEWQTERALERLVDAHLLESTPYGRYRLHDLVRLYARETADRTVPPAARLAALNRVVTWYADVTWRSFELIRPGDNRLTQAPLPDPATTWRPTDPTAALSWLETERANVQSVIAQAEMTPHLPTEPAIHLSQAMYAFFRLRNYWNEMLEVSQAGLRLSEAMGDCHAQATAHSDIGAALCQIGRQTEAELHLRRSADLFQVAGDAHGHAAALSLIGNVQLAQGELDLAYDSYLHSLALHTDLGYLRGQAMSCGNLGFVLREQRRYAEALTYHWRGIDLFHELGDRYGQAVGLASIGTLHRERGDLSRAEACLSRCLTIYRDMGDVLGEATALQELGIVLRLQDRAAAAREHQNQAVSMFRALGRRDKLELSLAELDRNPSPSPRSDQPVG